MRALICLEVEKHESLHSGDEYPLHKTGTILEIIYCRRSAQWPQCFVLFCWIVLRFTRLLLFLTFISYPCFLILTIILLHFHAGPTSASSTSGKFMINSHLICIYYWLGSGHEQIRHSSMTDTYAHTHTQTHRLLDWCFAVSQSNSRSWHQVVVWGVHNLNDHPFNHRFPTSVKDTVETQSIWVEETDDRLYKSKVGMTYAVKLLRLSFDQWN